MPKEIEEYVINEEDTCTKCGTEGSDNPNQNFEKAAIPANVLSHSIATSSLVGHILHQKYCIGVPLNRMEKELYSMGLVASRAALDAFWSWCKKTAGWKFQITDENPISVHLQQEDALGYLQIPRKEPRQVLSHIH